MRPSWHRARVASAYVSTSPSRVYAARLVGLPIFDPQGDQVGKVRDLVVAIRPNNAGVHQPRVLGLVVLARGLRLGGVVVAGVVTGRAVARAAGRARLGSGRRRQVVDDHHLLLLPHARLADALPPVLARQPGRGDGGRLVGLHGGRLGPDRADGGRALVGDDGSGSAGHRAGDGQQRYGKAHGFSFVRRAVVLPGARPESAPEC